MKKYIGQISYKTLSSTLKELETDRLVHREEYPQIPPKVEYSLTERGRSLILFWTECANGVTKTGFDMPVLSAFRIPALFVPLRSALSERPRTFSALEERLSHGDWLTACRVGSLSPSDKICQALRFIPYRR